MSTIKIQYVSDYTCPYCYASRVSLLKAIEGYDVEIEWLPYEGTPLSKPQVDSYHDPIRKRNYRRLISPVIKELGLDMKLPPRVIPRPYTHLAAEGHLFAKEHGLGEVYDARVYSILHGRTGYHNNFRCRPRRKWLWILTFYQHKNQQGNRSHMEHALLVLFYLSKSIRSILCFRIQFLLQLLGWTENRYAGCGNRCFFPGVRNANRSFRTQFGVKGAESGQCDPFALGKHITQCAENCLHTGFRRFLGHAGLLRNQRYKISLFHMLFPGSTARSFPLV